MKAINYKTIAILSLLVFVFLLGFSFSVQAYRISRQELNNPVSRYLRENYGVDSIEEYRAKLEQEAWLNISRQMEALATEYPELNFSEWQSPDVYRQYGTSTYQPAKITPQQQFYMAIFSEPVTALQVFSLSGLGLIGLAAVPPIRKNERLKQALVLGIVVLCVFSIGYFVGLTAAQTGTITIEPGSFTETASYVIWTDGTYVYAKNGKTGAIDFKGTDASTVIQSAVNALTSGGKIFIKAGTYVLKPRPATWGYACIDLSNKVNVELEGEGKSTVLKLIDNAKQYTNDVQSGNVIYYGNANYIAIRHLKIDGNKANNTDSGVDGDGCGIRGYATYRDIVEDVHFYNCVREGFYATNTQWSFYKDLFAEGCGYYGIVLDSLALATVVNVSTYNNKRAGLYIMGGATREPAYVTVIGGSHQYNEYFGVHITEAIGVTLVGVQAWRNSGAATRYDGFYINNSEAVSLIGCQSFENYRAGLLINASTRINVIGGAFFNNRYDGVDLAGSGIYIMGNSAYVKVIGAELYDNRSPLYQRYGIHEVSGDFNEFIGNLVTPNSLGGILKTGANTKVKYNTGYYTENFKSTGVSVTVGTGGAYGSASAITSPSGVITYPRVKITWGGTFGSGETVTVKVEAVYTDQSTAYVEKSATAVGSAWLTDDDVLTLVTQGKDIVKLNVYAKTNLSSTTVTVTVDAYGKA
jgi:hypothetical protein